MRFRNLGVALVLTGALTVIGGCNQPAEPQPVVVKKPIIEPEPAGPKVDVGGPRGGVHVDVPRDDGRDIRVDVPPLRNPPPANP
jgi:hypothetical protein